MTGIVSDDRHHIQPGCPVEAELYPIEGVAEVVIGDVAADGCAVRLVLQDVDTAHQLMEAVRHARNVLACYLYGDDAEEAAEPIVAKTPPDPDIVRWLGGDEALKPTVDDNRDEPGPTRFRHYDGEAEEPIVDEPCQDRSQPADSPSRKVVRHLTSM
ncbi:hypothetical protein ACWEVP_31825 [Amycolatopsis sp. NPDC003865]